MEKISEMSTSQFSRLRREHGIGVSSGATISAYVVTSKLRRHIEGITSDDFQWAKKEYGFHRHMSRGVMSNRMMTTLERMDDGMVRWIYDQYLEGGIRRVIEVMRMNFKEIRKQAGLADGGSLPEDHIQGY